MPPETPQPSAPPLSPSPSPMSQIHECRRRHTSVVEDEEDDVFYSPATTFSAPIRTHTVVPQLLQPQQPPSHIEPVITNRHNNNINVVAAGHVFCNICYETMSTATAPNRRFTSKGQWCGNCNSNQFHTEELHFTFMTSCECCGDETEVYKLYPVKFHGNSLDVCVSCYKSWDY